jgi:hypothetical protein
MGRWKISTMARIELVDDATRVITTHRRDIAHLRPSVTFLHRRRLAVAPPSPYSIVIHLDDSGPRRPRP